MTRPPISSADLPKSAVHSILLSGEERIRGNIFYPGSATHSCILVSYNLYHLFILAVPIKGLPCGKVHTVYDVFRRGKEQSRDGPAIGEVHLIFDIKYSFAKILTVFSIIVTL